MTGTTRPLRVPARVVSGALLALAVLAGDGVLGRAPAQVAPGPAAPGSPQAPGPPGRPSTPAPAAPRPGTAAPAPVVAELRTALEQGAQRFEAKDLDGLLGYVSEQYWTGPFTKASLQAQLAAIFQFYPQVRARVRIDEVRLVGPHAWVYSTGELSGQLPLVGQWTTFLWWDRELEVARREGGTWRLYGYQQ